MSDLLRLQLVRSFKHLYEGPPNWAWSYPPSIPFIGREYDPERGLLVYASAENLAWMNKQPVPDRFKTDEAWDRYRAVYEQEGKNSSDFFPEVGIAPISNGGLLVAAWFLAERTGDPLSPDPRRFLETFAFSNWAKFSISAPTNRDYINDIKKLGLSLAYVINELSALNPKVVLVPKAIWRLTLLREAMRGATPSARFIPVPQFNSQVVNCHLSSYEDAAYELRQQHSFTTVGEWISHLHRVSKIHAWKYLAHLHTLCENH